MFSQPDFVSIETLGNSLHTLSGPLPSHLQACLPPRSMSLPFSSSSCRSDEESLNKPAPAEHTQQSGAQTHTAAQRDPPEVNHRQSKVKVGHLNRDHVTCTAFIKGDFGFIFICIVLVSQGICLLHALTSLCLT